MTNAWDYEPANVYYKRKAMAWQTQAYQQSMNRLVQDAGSDYGYSPDAAPVGTTVMDQPVITGRDIDSILKGPGAGGGGGGLLSDLGGILSDVGDTVFQGPIHKPWDVLRPLKRVMDAENRYIAQPVASGVYEGITGKDYEDANPVIKGILETAASPSTYIGPGLVGKLGAGTGITALERFAATEKLPQYLARNLAGNAAGVVGGALAQKAGLPPILGSFAGGYLANKPFERNVEAPYLGINKKELDAYGPLMPGPQDEAMAYHAAAVPEDQAKRTLIMRNSLGLDELNGPKSQNLVRAGDLHVGGLKPYDVWAREAEGILTPDEINAAARWYPEIRGVLQKAFQTEDPKKYVNAFLASQVNNSPSGGLRNVLRAMDKLDLGNRGFVAGSSTTNEESIMNALREFVSLKGISQKISDFIDSQLGKSTRSWTRNDPRGGSPFTVDVWQGRDAGYIDEPLAKYIETKTGKTLDELGLQKDFVYGTNKKTGKPEGGTFAPSEKQYEVGSRWGNGLTDYLNQQNWMGRNDWTTPEIQAIAWVKVRKAMGIEEGTLNDAVRDNTRTVTAAMSPDSPIGQALANEELLPREKDRATQSYMASVLAHAQELVPQAKVSNFGTFPGDEALFDVFGSPESAQDIASVVAYHTGADAIAMRPLKSGKTRYVDVSAPDITPQQLQQMRQYLGPIAERIVPGSIFERETLRLVNPTKGWSQKQIEDAVSRAADAAGVPADAQVTLFPGNMEVTTHNGQSALEELATRGRPEAVRALQDPTALQQQWVAKALEDARTPPTVGGGANVPANANWSPSATAGGQSAAAGAGGTGGTGGGGPGGPVPGTPGQPLPPAGPGINAVPDTALRRLLGGSLPQSGLTAADRAVNALKRAVGLGFEEHELATPVMRARGQLQQTADSLAVRLGATIDRRVRQVFKLDEAGRIDSLPLLDPQGNIVYNAQGDMMKPTVQDVAARLPAYESHLKPDELKLMDELRTETEYYNDALREQGVEYGSRVDVMPGIQNVQDGGFYLPRGDYTPTGFNAQGKAGIGGARRGKSAYRKTATFDSMSQGIEAGGTYAPLGDAMYTYARQAGQDAIDAYTARVFKNLRDDTGDLISQTPRDRLEAIAPGLQKQVQDLRAKISGKVQTLRSQTARARTAGAFTGRLQRNGARLEARLTRAADALSGHMSDEAFDTRLSDAESALQAAEAHAKQIDAAYQMSTTNREATAGTLREARQQLENYYRNTEPKLTPPQMDAMRSLIRDSAQGVRNAGAGLSPLLNDFRNRAQDALTTAERDLEAAQLQGVTGSELAAAQAKVRDLRLMQQKVQNTTLDEVNRVASLQGKATTTAADLGQLRADLKSISGQYRNALARAAQTPRDAAQIGLGNLAGISFPVDVANAANKYLRAEVPSSGLGQSLKVLNGLMRGVSATGDASFMGIQGVLGLGHSPGSYGKAWSAAMKAFGDSETLGKVIEDFDSRAAAAGLPDSREWLKAGLHLGGVESEYQLGKRALAGERGIPALASKIGSMGLPRRSNQAFGTFGDTLRLEAAQVMQQANPGATMEEMANAANLMTGWTRGKFLGDLGDYVQFAPRFFQSQLDLLAKALNPLNRSASAGQARWMLGKMVGLGALITYGVNEALGQPTDLNPNSNNFMRIRALGQDISLFGPWDSLLRAFVHAGQGDFEYAARTKASPLVRNVWDALTGSTFVGDKALNPLKPVEAVTEPERIKTFLQQFVPMSFQNVAQGELPTSPEGAASLGLNLAGVKASALSKADVLDELSREAYGKDWTDLTGGQIARLADLHPDQITPTQARKAAGIKAALEPYHDIENQVWAKVRARPEFHGYETLNDYVAAKARELTQMGVPREQLGDKLSQLPIVKQVSTAVSELHDRYRIQHPDVDQILVDWYGANPIRRRAGNPSLGRSQAAQQPYRVPSSAVAAAR